MKPFQESDRYDYPLTPNSVVFDVGAYEGNFAREIHAKYGCRVVCFEPVFYRQLQQRFAVNAKIVVLPFGLGGRSHTQSMGVSGDSKGKHSPAAQRVMVEIVNVCEMQSAYGPVDLLKLNCETAEFEILEALLEHGRTWQIQDIQVQFHRCAPDAERRRQMIRNGLLCTHALTFDAPWCWENYRIKP